MQRFKDTLNLDQILRKAVISTEMEPGYKSSLVIMTDYDTSSDTHKCALSMVYRLLRGKEPVVESTGLDILGLEVHDSEYPDIHALVEDKLERYIPSVLDVFSIKHEKRYPSPSIVQYSLISQCKRYTKDETAMIFDLDTETLEGSSSAYRAHANFAFHDLVNIGSDLRVAGKLDTSNTAFYIFDRLVGNN